MVRKKLRPRAVLLGLLLFLVLVSMLTFYIWYQTEAVRLGLKIRDCEEKIKSLRDDIQKLEIRKASLLAPGRVETIAKEALGLVEPADADVFFDSRGSGR